MKQFCKKIFLTFTTLISANLFLCTSLFAQDGKINVRVGAIDANPPIFIETTGNAEAGNLMRSTLSRCDWFTIVGSKSQAKYIVKFDASDKYSCNVYDSNGKFVGNWTTSIKMPKREASFRLTDLIITAINKNPGLCNSRIAFVVANGNKREVYTCNFDGSEAKRATFNNAVSTEPNWQPNASIFYYSVTSAAKTQIIKNDQRTNIQNSICNNTGLLNNPAPSPCGKFLSAAISINNQVDLYLINLSTKKESKLTNDKSAESSPTWNANSSKVCYVSDKLGSPRLFIADVKTRSSTSLRPMLYKLGQGGTRGDSTGEYGSTLVGPSWCHISNKIAYTVRFGGRDVVAIVDMAKDPRSAIIITPGAGNWEDPSWAPDGRHIVCTKTVNGKRSLWQIDSVFGTAKQITNAGNGDHSLPSWSSLLK